MGIEGVPRPEATEEKDRLLLEEEYRKVKRYFSGEFEGKEADKEAKRILGLVLPDRPLSARSGRPMESEGEWLSRLVRQRFDELREKLGPDARKIDEEFEKG